MENIVYIELLRRGYNVSVGKIKDKEVDFVCEKYGNYRYVQVYYVLFSQDTMDGEFNPLFLIPDKFETFLITTDTFDFSYDGVKHLNIIDFLLGDGI